MLKDRKLNQFIARLYNGRLEDLPVYQNFKLTYEPGSLIQLIRNEPDTLTRFRADLEHDVDIFNSSTIGTHVLMEMMTDLDESKVPSTAALKRKVLSKLHADGYYSIGFNTEE